MRTASGWRTVVAALSLVVVGAAAGIAVDRFLHRPRVHAVDVRTMTHEQAMALLDREVHLRPEQRARVGEILEQRQGDIDHAWRQAHLHIAATVDKVMSEIEAELDPDQVPPFRALVKRLHGEGSAAPLPMHGAQHP